MSTRRRRGPEAGFTLVEVLVAMAVVAVALVVIVGSFAQAQRIGGVTVGQAAAEATARAATDGLRSGTGPPYVPCAAPGAYPVAGARVTAVAMVAPVAGAGRAAAVWDCTTGAAVASACPAMHTCDYGLQRLTITVTTPSGGSLMRVVFKGRR